MIIFYVILLYTFKNICFCSNVCVCVQYLCNLEFFLLLYNYEIFFHNIYLTVINVFYLAKYYPVRQYI